MADRAPFHLVPCEPVGREPSTALVSVRRPDGACSSGFIPVSSPTFAPTPRGEQLRKLRIGDHASPFISLLTAARVLGLRGYQLSELEDGEAVLESEAEWNRAEALLRDARRAMHAGAMQKGSTDR